MDAFSKKGNHYLCRKCKNGHSHSDLAVLTNKKSRIQRRNNITNTTLKCIERNLFTVLKNVICSFKSIFKPA